MKLKKHSETIFLSAKQSFQEMFNKYVVPKRKIKKGATFAEINFCKGRGLK